MKKIIVISSVLAVLTTSCLKEIFCIDGNGNIETQSRNATLFDQLENSTSVDVVYKKADITSITVKAESNLLDHIITETQNGKLKITTDPRNACFNTVRRPLITVTSPELNSLVLTGSGNLEADAMASNSVTILLTGSADISAEVISCNDLSLTITGSGDIDIVDASCQKPDFLITGSGDLSIKGAGDNGKLKITGSGDIDSDEFPIVTAAETISGSGNIHTRVVNSLTAVISGSGNIYLKGNPTINQTITGSGRIIKN